METHPVITKLQGSHDPAEAVAEMMKGASMLAQSVGITLTYSIGPVDPAVQPSYAVWLEGIKHLHAATAFIGTRTRSPFTSALQKLKGLPHVPIDTLRPTDVPTPPPNG